jgi:hypothetical protein
MGEPALNRPASRGSGCGIEAVLHTSVATLYSNLVTRPTGHAVRHAIEQQIAEAGGACLSILDFSQVGVLDFSCADEIIAKLLAKYRNSDRPCEAFFVLQGVAEHHKEPIETVLQRRNLLLVAVEHGRPVLWGPAPVRLRKAWEWLGRTGRTFSDQFALAEGLNQNTASAWLRRLVNWRVAILEESDCFASLSALLAEPKTEAHYGLRV